MSSAVIRYFIVRFHTCGVHPNHPTCQIAHRTCSQDLTIPTHDIINAVECIIRTLSQFPFEIPSAFCQFLRPPKGHQSLSLDGWGLVYR